MKFIFTLLFALLYCNLVFSQQRLNYSEEQIKIFAKEVYKNCPEYITDEHIQLYKKQFERFSLVELKETMTQNYFITKTLENFSLNSKCNNQLRYDTGENFNPDSFNILKYLFVEIPLRSAILINGTNYLLIID